MKKDKDSFELKADMMPLTVIKVRSADIEQFQVQWQNTLEHAPNYFTNAPVVIDVNGITHADNLDLKSLCDTLKASAIIPVGIKGLAKKYHGNAIENGLAILTAQAKVQNRNKQKQPEATNTKIITKAVRSGSQVYAKQSDLIVIASVNPGAEVIADGNIHIYGPLRGRALAGATGNTQARIFCQQCDAELISIAGHYLVKDNLVTPTIDYAMLHIYLNQEQLIIEGI